MKVLIQGQPVEVELTIDISPDSIEISAYISKVLEAKASPLLGLWPLLSIDPVGNIIPHMSTDIFKRIQELYFGDYEYNDKG